MNDFNSNIIKAQNALLRFAKSLDKYNADDILQDTNERLLIKQNLYTPNTNFLSWSKTVMYHVFINRKKKERFTCDLECTETITSFSSCCNVPSCDYDYEFYINSFNMLSDRMREFAILFFVNGYSYIEISERLNVSIGTVKSNLHDIRAFFFQYHNIQHVNGKVCYTDD